MKTKPWIHRITLSMAAAMTMWCAPQAMAATGPLTAAGCPVARTAGLVNTGLPVVEIWTAAAAPIVDRENYVKGCLRITDGSRQTYGAGLYEGAIDIRGRGNSTWDMPKKSYRVKLASPGAAVLDMPADRDWVLLANYADKTLMRGDLGFELSRRLGMAWTPRMRHVDVYLNGDFVGNYQLGEHVKVATNRVNVAPLLATDLTEPAIGGGYLVAADYPEYVSPSDIVTTTASGILFNIKAPGTKVQPQYDYLTSYLQKVETALLSNNFNASTGYPALIDADSFIDWWIVKELAKDVDGPFYASVYLYKDRGGKLKMGPLWDFDLDFGNVDFSVASQPTGWYIRTQSEWFAHLFQDRAFRQKAYNRWKAVRPLLIDTLPTFLDINAAALDTSQRENFKRWDILKSYVWPNNEVAGSYTGEVAYLKDWLRRRITWIDRNLKP